MYVCKAFTPQKLIIELNCFHFGNSCLRDQFCGVKYIFQMFWSKGALLLYGNNFSSSIQGSGCRISRTVICGSICLRLKNGSKQTIELSLEDNCTLAAIFCHLFTVYGPTIENVRWIFHFIHSNTLRLYHLLSL